MRNWLAITRLALRTDPSLGGIATGLEWAGEEHRLLPNRNQARTIAAGALAINVSADMVGDLIPTDGTWPPVTSTHPTLSVKQ
ncbi:hypothetical protein G5V59_26970 [Nocardioides sp. W3-2-3]|uniref:hypothetical protein n=1 Tax=Nocardioides convexus TaxID=2712224 RepID=UPI002418B67D|nr:hypothetical protein [Nocardioides convexus]NHA02035.1 hypothetical protein [Nocardioides convexus]